MERLNGCRLGAKLKLSCFSPAFQADRPHEFRISDRHGRYVLSQPEAGLPGRHANIVRFKLLTVESRLMRDCSYSERSGDPALRSRRGL